MVVLLVAVLVAVTADEVVPAMGVVVAVLVSPVVIAVAEPEPATG